MPKRVKELTAREVDRLKAVGDGNRRVMVGPADCAGLHIRLEGGAKHWAIRIKVGEQRRDIGLGTYNGKFGVTDEAAARLDGLSLSEARAQARDVRYAVRVGSMTTTPAAERKANVAAASAAVAQVKTFKECTALCLADKSGEWKSAKHEKQWAATLETYAFPVIGSLPISGIDRGLVLDVLRPIWATKSETAGRVRGRMETVLAWAKVNGYRDGENPATWKGNLEHSLAKRQKLTRGHHAALPYPAAPAFMAELAKRDGLSARALEFAILTAARSGEVRGATWDEIDTDAKLWTVPAQRMKAGREHVVPLSSGALTLLAGLPRVDGSPLLFPAPRGGTLSDMSLTAVLKRMGLADLTQHGFRSTFRDWAGETTAHPREVIEHALAHQLKDKAEAAYQRGSLLTKRQALMADWASYLSNASNHDAEQTTGD